MKKLILLIAISFAATHGYSQISKGQWMVGGNAGFSTSSTGGLTQTIVTFAPNAGYFFIDKLAGGLEVSINSSKVSEQTATSTFIAPFLRYYFLPKVQKVNVFGQAAYGFGSQSFGGESASSNAFSISAGPAVFLNPNTALEFGLQYVSRGGEGGGNRISTFGLNIGFQIHLGRPAK